MKRLVVLLLLLAIVSAQISEPKLVSRLDSRITQGGVISVMDGSIHFLELNLTSPQSTDYQSSDNFGKKVFDEEGNLLIFISEENPPNPYSYSIESRVTTTERITTHLPKSYSVPADFIRYVRSSETVQSDHPAVKELAESIIAGTSNDFERVALLTEWVHNNVQYDLGLVGQRKDSLWILENRRGVCVEYSNLFAALARSLGYPTRFVLGQAYGDYGWLGHAWNEIYIGDWIPVDATWLEAGHLDATHVEFYKSAESEANNRVIAKVTNPSSLVWEKPEFAGESGGTSVEISSIDTNPPIQSYSLSLVSPSLAFGESTLAIFSMIGRDYRIVDLNLVECRSDREIIRIENPKRTAILEPDKTTIVSWVLTANAGLNPSMTYTCPLTLNSRYLEQRSVSLEVTNKQKNPELTAFLSDESISLGETVSVFVKTTKPEKLAVASTDYFESRLSTTGNTKFSFIPARQGVHEVFVASERGGLKTLSFSVQKSQKPFHITRVVFPEHSYAGEEIFFQVHLENKLTDSEQANVEIFIDDFEHLSRVPLTELDRIEFSFVPTTPGEKTAKIRFNLNGITDEKTASFFVYEEPAMVLGEPSLEQKGEMVLASFPVELSDSVVSAYVSLGGNRQKITSGEASFLLEQSLHKVNLEWTDVRGGEHRGSAIVNTVMPALPQDFWGTYGFFLASLLAVMAFLVFFLLSKTGKSA